MTRALLVAGGGIGGLAAAIAANRAGWSVRVLEQAAQLSELGAGIQLGPNSTRVLREWALLDERLARLVAQPARLIVRDALDGTDLGTLALHDFEERYGAPYFTLHRADLQEALADEARARGVELLTDHRVQSPVQDEGGVHVTCSTGPEFRAEALIGADGLWSTVRGALWNDAAPRFVGHLAYRAMLRQADLPAAERSEAVTAWLGTGMHLVTYPVRGCEYLNVVCIVEGPRPGADAHSWDHAGVREQLLSSLGSICVPARERIESVPAWRMWPLHARRPLAGAHGMVQGRVALLGDAAHPFLPYLAQGAGMAIEDARELQRVLPQAGGAEALRASLRRYGTARWRRSARVQARSQRNGRIFHAGGALRFARNLALRVVGERMIDVPWLYSG